MPSPLSLAWVGMRDFLSLSARECLWLLATELVFSVESEVVEAIELKCSVVYKEVAWAESSAPLSALSTRIEISTENGYIIQLPNFSYIHVAGVVTVFTCQ